MSEVWTVWFDRSRIDKEPFLVSIATTEEKANEMRDKLKEEWSTIIDKTDLESLRRRYGVATMEEEVNLLSDDLKEEYKEGFECHIVPLKLDTLLGTDF